MTKMCFLKMFVFLKIILIVFLLMPATVKADNCCSTVTITNTGISQSTSSDCESSAEMTRTTCEAKGSASVYISTAATYKDNAACDANKKTCVSTKATTTEPKLKPINFSFNVPLPGFPAEFEVDSSVLPNYIIWLYKFVFAVAGLLAVFMITIGGIIWIFAGGNSSRVTKAKEFIFGSVAGLLLAIFSYSILYIINPELVANRIPQIKTIDKVELEDVYTSVAGNLSNIGNVGSPSYYCTPMANIKGIPTDLKCNPEDARKLGAWLYNEEICVGACHCAWSVSAFLQYLGCKAPYSVSAPGLADAATKQGWQAIPYDRNTKDNYIGILYMEGHVGLYLGQGMAFQSGGLHPKVKHVPQSTVLNKDLSCSKVPGHLVKDGLYMAGRGGVASCSSVQAWVYHKVNENYGSSGWKTIYKLPSNAATGGTGTEACKNPPATGAAGLSGGTGDQCKSGATLSISKAKPSKPNLTGTWIQREFGNDVYRYQTRNGTTSSVTDLVVYFHGLLTVGNFLTDNCNVVQAEISQVATKKYGLACIHGSPADKPWDNTGVEGKVNEAISKFKAETGKAPSKVIIAGHSNAYVAMNKLIASSVDSKITKYIWLDACYLDPGVSTKVVGIEVTSKTNKNADGCSCSSIEVRQNATGHMEAIYYLSEYLSKL